ncbi:MAG TPA: hypothetical protein VFP72_14105 [Kineosporiaceae bacterium]|nr:hypothetical protein [Kineosporiaceae bacterium]
MPGAYMPPQKPHPTPPAPPDPTRHQFGTPSTLGTHDPYNTPAATNSPTVDSKIKVTPEVLENWATLFENAGKQLNQAGDTMMKVKVEPGYFQEADTVRKLVEAFNAAFVPNTRTLSDSSQYVARALRLAAKSFDNVEKANLDQNTALMDLVSSLTKAESGLKSTPTVAPNTPTK